MPEIGDLDDLAGEFVLEFAGHAAVVFALMFSQRVRKRMDTNKIVRFLGNYSFLFAVIALIVVGGMTGEFKYEFSGQIVKVPDFGHMFMQVSPFFIGFPDLHTWLHAAPIAIIAWVIAYGDFITVKQLGLQALREDEFIEFDSDRTNVNCGIRNQH